jgi:hypothetical protein
VTEHSEREAPPRAHARSIATILGILVRCRDAVFSRKSCRLWGFLYVAAVFRVGELAESIWRTANVAAMQFFPESPADFRDFNTLPRSTKIAVL